MGPQGPMGLYADVVFDVHGLFQNLWVLNAPWGCLLLWYLMVMFLLEYVGPQYAMGLSVCVAFASHILFYLKVCGFFKAPWGCLFCGIC